MKHAQWIKSTAAAVVVATLGAESARAATSSSSSAFYLDTREGARTSAGTETIAYSSRWDGGDGAKVTISQSCATPCTTSGPIFSDLAGEGERTWTAQYDGEYTLTHTTVADGAADKVETATFVVSGLGLPKINGGNEPGEGSVPAGGLSKFDVEVQFDGAGHAVDAAAVLAAFQGVLPGVSVGYAFSDDAAEWTAEPVSFTNACVTSVWYKAAFDGYEDFVKEVKVTVVPRDIAKAFVEPIGRFPFKGIAVKPEPVVTDGDPSIITKDDYSVSYKNNEGPGLATLTLNGKNNYTGTKDVNFSIGTAELTAKIGWKFLRATGTYFAHLEAMCTNSLEAGVSDLKFLFADRPGNDGSLLAALWNTPGRAANANTAEYNGATYRCVALDASKIAAENTAVVYGVSDLSAATIPVEERTIEMYVQRRVVPETGNEGAAEVDSFVGFLSWKTGEETKAVPVVAGKSRSLSSLHAIQMLSAPVSAARLNTALAVGVMPDEGCGPYCRFLDFTVDDGMILGKVEVGAGAQVGTPGENARLVLLGGDSPGGPFAELCEVEVAADGSFAVPEPEDARFFKVALEIGEVVK